MTPVGKLGKGVARRTVTTEVVDLMAIAAVTAGLAILAVRLWRGLHTFSDSLTGVMMLAAGYLLADLLTGFVHWFCDTFFEETTAIIGPGLIAPFREHHRDPLLMTRHGFLELTGSSFRALAPLLALYVGRGGSMPAYANALVFALATGAVATNLLHRWAHDPAAPAMARLLQRIGLVLSPDRHARHHAPPYAAAYCVTSGWLNPICERLGIWTRAEAVFVALGMPVSRGDHD